MAKLINGNGNLAIYAEEDADWFGSIFGNTTAITGIGNQFAYSLLDANTVGVQDGVIISKEGRRVQLNANEIDEFDIPTGAQGTTSYYIIGYHLITDETSAQTCETFVELMDNGTDTIPEGTFRGGDDDVYISLYRVKQVDLTISTVTLLLPKVSGIIQLNTNLTELTEINTPISVRVVHIANSNRAQITLTYKDNYNVTHTTNVESINTDGSMYYARGSYLFVIGKLFWNITIADVSSNIQINVNVSNMVNNTVITGTDSVSGNTSQAFDITITF